MCPRYHLSFCTCTTAWLAPDIHISMGPSPLCLVFPPKTAPFGAELQVSMGTRTHLPFCGCKKAWLPSELLISIGPSPHLWLLEAKERLLHQKNKCLWVPDTTCHFVHAKQLDYHLKYYSPWVSALLCGFCMQNSVFWTRITSLYGSQTWPVVLGMYISVFSSRNTSLYWPKTSSVVFACKTAWLAPELIVSVGPSPHVLFLNAKQRLFDRNYTSLCVPDISCRFMHA